MTDTKHFASIADAAAEFARKGFVTMESHDDYRAMQHPTKGGTVIIQKTGLLSVRVTVEGPHA